MGRKLSGSKFANMIIILAIVIIPLMYAGLLTWAYEAPLTRVNTLKAAVVNLDHSAKAKIGEETKILNLGKDLEKELLAKNAPGFAWIKADLEEAEKGLASGKYRATLIIPENFSSNFAILANPENTPPNPSVIDLRTDDAVNYLAGSMATTVAKGLETIVSQNGAKEYIGQALLSFQSIKTGLEAGSKGASDLSQGLQQLSSGNNTAYQGSTKLATGLDRLNSGIKTLNGGVHQLSNGSNSLVVGMENLANGSVEIRDKAVVIKDGATALALGSQTLSSGLAEFAKGADKLAAGVDAFSAALQPSSSPQNSASLKTGSTALNQGLKQLAEVAHQTEAAFTPLEAGITQLENGLDQAGAASEKLVQGGRQLQGAFQENDGKTTLKDGTKTMLAFTQKLAGLCQQMDKDPACQILTAQLGTQGWDGLVSSAKQLDSGIDRAGKGVEELTQSTDKLSQVLTGKNSSQPTLADGLTRLRNALLSMNPATPSIRLGVSSLSQGLDQAQSGANKLDEGITLIGGKAQLLHQGFTTLFSHTPDLTQGAESLAKGAKQLADGTPKAISGLERLAAGNQQALNGAKQLNSGVKQLSNGGKELENGSNQVLQGANALAQGSQKLASGSEKAEAGADRLAKELKAGNQKIPQLSQTQSEKIASVAAAPVQVKEIREHAVYENGIGFAPFFLGLGLWIGGIALFLIFPALDIRRSQQEIFYVCALRSLGTTLIFGALQALVVVSGLQLLLNLNAVYLLPLYGICLLSSFCFVSINQACVAALGFRGRFLSVLLLCLQLTTAGATFPIETAPKFLQALHPFLPMTYTVNAVRSLVAGGEIGLALPILVLIIWMIGAWLVTFYASFRRHGLKPMPFDPALAFPGNSPKELVS